MMNKKIFLLTLFAPLALLACQEQAELPQPTVTELAAIPVSASTGKKPQSKLWRHDGFWWAVLPSDTVVPAGTWLWRLEEDDSWANVLWLSSSTESKADALRSGNLAHVMLHDDVSELVSLEYVAEERSYRLWNARSRNTPIPLPDSETATIALDSTGRMWLATESGSAIHMHYSDSPYEIFMGPVILAEGVDRGDIGVVTALPDGRIGVLWSDQTRRRFGFKFHVDGEPPKSWSRDEAPASISAMEPGAGVADDHLNVAVSSDGTIYVAVKTGYDSPGYPKIALLVRHAAGWDGPYEVDREGTRPIILLNERDGKLLVVYTRQERPGGIVCRESTLSPIEFGPRSDLMIGDLNNATSTKEPWTDEVVILASGSGLARGVRLAKNRR
jgi:hypothetical protein